MDAEKRTVAEKAKAISGGLAAVTGIVAAVTQLTGALPDALKGLSGLSLGVWWFFAAILVIVGAVWAWDGLSARSRLLRPEAMYLRADDPRHLAGRADDIERLLRICTENPLVYLVGESGAGKSALVQAGLVPRLKHRRKLCSNLSECMGARLGSRPED